MTRKHTGMKGHVGAGPGRTWCCEADPSPGKLVPASPHRPTLPCWSPDAPAPGSTRVLCHSREHPRVVSLPGAPACCV